METHRKLNVNEQLRLDQKIETQIWCTGTVSVLCFSRNYCQVAHVLMSSIVQKKKTISTVDTCIL